jgi:hypothetical protein
VLAGPDVQKKFASLGTYTHPADPAATEAFIQKEQLLWRPAVERIFGLAH